MAKLKMDILDENLEKIASWIREGLFENQIYPRLGLSKPTWEKYKKIHSTLMDVIDTNRKIRNENLVPELQNLMLKRARGYIDEFASVEETTKIDENGSEMLIRKVVKKSIPPDVAAIQICLKNFTRDNESPWTDNPQGDKLKKEKQAVEIAVAQDKLNGW